MRAFLRHQGGTVALVFGLAMPTMGIAMAGAIDLSTWYSARNRLQAAADSAALAAARELQLASAAVQQVSKTAESYVRLSLADKGPAPTSITATSSSANRTVQVTVTAEVSPIFSRYMYDGLHQITVTSVGRLSGSAPICVIGLDETQAGTLHFEKRAQLTANRCAVYSNSKNPQGVQGEDRAVLKAALFCSAGGFSGPKANFDPAPVTDCPPVKDPLASRVGPLVGGCTAFAKVVDKKELATLAPGTYCGGLTVTDSAAVTLLSGVYVIKDGPLTVNKKASLQGQNVGLYFSGDKAALLFDKDSTVSLTAPKDGPMAGILISEERQVSSPTPTPPPLPDQVTGILPSPPPTLPSAAPPMRNYRIISDNARTLLGTIYLPSGRLMIDSSKPVADRSAYTVIVARRLDLFDGPNLYLNSDYGLTDIPVPQGVGPVGGSVSLVQ